MDSHSLKGKQSTERYSVFDIFIKILGPILAITLACFTILIVYTLLTIAIPSYHFRPLTLLFHIGLSSWILLNIVFNYVMVVFTDPGSTRKYFANHPPDRDNLTEIRSVYKNTETDTSTDENNVVITLPDNPNTNHRSSDNATKSHHANTDYETTPPRRERFCKKCNLPKPPRAHHCSVCRKCILAMDHHCPWILNCVGFYNHKYFLLFLTYLWAGCTYAAIIIGPLSFDFVNAEVLIVVSGIFSVVFSFVLLLFNSYQYYLILYTAQTQSEIGENHFFMKKVRRKGKKYLYPYDLGFKKNFQILFGTGSEWWNAFIPSFDPPTGDGVHFKRSVTSANQN